MDHDAYETQMIDSINRHGEEAAKEKAAIKLDRVITKNDTRTVVRGLKRVFLALLTAALFGASVFGLITVATAHGYWAVGLFVASLLVMALAFILLYAQGIGTVINLESMGRTNERTM